MLTCHEVSKIRSKSFYMAKAYLRLGAAWQSKLKTLTFDMFMWFFVGEKYFWIFKFHQICQNLAVLVRKQAKNHDFVVHLTTLNCVFLKKTYFCLKNILIELHLGKCFVSFRGLFPVVFTTRWHQIFNEMKIMNESSTKWMKNTKRCTPSHHHFIHFSQNP